MVVGNLHGICLILVKPIYTVESNIEELFTRKKDRSRDHVSCRDHISISAGFTPISRGIFEFRTKQVIVNVNK